MVIRLSLAGAMVLNRAIHNGYSVEIVEKDLQRLNYAQKYRQC